MSPSKQKKNKHLRHIEYYGLQETFDNLYQNSKDGKIFSNLMEVISSPENIKLAYRNIKGNDGSRTSGVDGRTIEHLSKLSEGEFISLIQKQFHWYKPHPVRRIEIPKPNGKMRPLGIPTIVDRIVQQCILQLLEPICEAKFYKQSYGFRPNRSAEHAIATSYFRMQRQQLHYVVDVDIEGFFDNVHHGKLIRQLWHMGIRDKKLLCIIKAMLKAPIILPDGKMLNPTKGTPQGGVLSPLLSNVVLNELDWWIASQWEELPTKYPYKNTIHENGTVNKRDTYRALRTTALKEMYIVRYADDFKIFCKNYEDAKRVYRSVTQWLEEHLNLKTSEEKSKITNLKRQYSEFLGFKMKVHPKGKKFVVKSHVCDKAEKRMKSALSDCIKEIQTPTRGKNPRKSESPTEEHVPLSKQEVRSQYEAISRYNATIAGMHNYYRIATKAMKDFDKIGNAIRIQTYNRLPELTKSGTIPKGFTQREYGKSAQIRYLGGHPLIPVAYPKPSIPRVRDPNINKYTAKGRESIHKNLGIDTSPLIQIMGQVQPNRSIQFVDNQLSLFAAQYGRCAVTGEQLTAHTLYTHHKKPTELGGTDEYRNLMIVKLEVHALIHAENPRQVRTLLDTLNLNQEQTVKINKLRKLAGVNPL